jgi:MFS family permease
VFLTVFVDLLGFGMVLPLLPLYGKSFATQHGYSDQEVGWMVGVLMASFSAMQFLFVPVWGRLSDRWGRRPVLIIGLAGSTLFYGLFGLATAWQSLAGLFVARIGAGIAGATIATAQAYIADVTTKERRARGMALIGAAFALGFTLGPLLGATALLAGGDVALSPWPGYVASGLSGTALLLACFLLPESLRPDSGPMQHSLVSLSAMRTALATPSVGLLILTSFIAVFSFANFESTLSVLIERMVARFRAGSIESGLLAWLTDHVHRWGYREDKQATLVVVLVVFAYLGTVLTLAQGVLVRRLSTRWSEPVMASAGAVLTMIGFVLLAVATIESNFSLTIAAVAIEVVGFAFVNPSLQSLISRRSDPAQQGGILGLAQSASSLARILGPVSGLALFHRSADWPYWAAAAVMALGLLLIVIAARTGKDFEPRPMPT